MRLSQNRESSRWKRTNGLRMPRLRSCSRLWIRAGCSTSLKTMANHPDLAKRWMVFANHILGKSTLSVRDRELVILRIGYLCQSGYEWGQHVSDRPPGGDE